MRILLWPVVLFLAALGTSCGDSDKDTYVKENEGLLDSLRTFPEAVEERRTSASYVEDEHSPIAGYTTNVVFSVPEGTTREEVIDFYNEALPGWEMQLEEIPISDSADVVLIANFERGAAFIQVNTDGFAVGSQNTFELVLDHSHND